MHLMHVILCNLLDDYLWRPFWTMRPFAEQDGNSMGKP